MKATPPATPVGDAAGDAVGDARSVATGRGRRRDVRRAHDTSKNGYARAVLPRAIVRDRGTLNHLVVAEVAVHDPAPVGHVAVQVAVAARVE